MFSFAFTYMHKLNIMCMIIMIDTFKVLQFFFSP